MVCEETLPEGIKLAFSQDQVAEWLIGILVGAHGWEKVADWTRQARDGRGVESPLCDASYELQDGEVYKLVDGRRAGRVGGRALADFLKGYAEIGLPEVVQAADLYLILPEASLGTSPIDKRLRASMHMVNHAVGQGPGGVFERAAPGRYAVRRSINYRMASVFRETLGKGVAGGPENLLAAARAIWKEVPHNLVAACVVAGVHAAHHPVPDDLARQARSVLESAIARIGNALQHLREHPPGRADQIEDQLRERSARYEGLLHSLCGREEDTEVLRSDSDGRKVAALINLVQRVPDLARTRDDYVRQIRADALALLKGSATKDEVNPLAVVVVDVLCEARWRYPLEPHEKVDITIEQLLEVLAEAGTNVPEDRAEIIETFTPLLKSALLGRFQSL